jgi:hypothetical protein
VRRALWFHTCSRILAVRPINWLSLFALLSSTAFHSCLSLRESEAHSEVCVAAAVVRNLVRKTVFKPHKDRVKDREKRAKQAEESASHLVGPQR